MAQSASTFPQSIKNPPPSVRNLQQVQQNQEYIVVHQQPPTRSERFPYSLSIKCIFGFSIAECVIASIMIIVGTAIRVMGVGYHTTYIALPIWCGLVILANGIIGCILKWKQYKCLLGVYLGLSIISLILTLTMLAPYSMDLDFFEQIRPECSSYPYYRCNTVFGLIGFLVVLMICEFACSVASISLSCKAYSKCCNTCNADDCCTCLGCCECDATPFNYHQVEQNDAGPYTHHPMQMNASASFNPIQACVKTNVQIEAQENAQFLTGWQTNPFSGIMTYFVNLPASFFDSENKNVAQPVSFNVTAQPVATSNQDSANDAQQI